MPQVTSVVTNLAPQTTVERLSAPIHVLVLDDSNFDRLRIKRELDRLGRPYQLVERNCLCELGQTLRAEKFDLIVVDYFLPDGNGLEAIKLIQDDPNHKDCDLVLVSGNMWLRDDDPVFSKNSVTFVSKNELGLGAVTDIFAKCLER